MSKKSKLHILSIIGARPQFIKVLPICRAIQKTYPDLSHTLVHTGQHYDYNMSEIFFKELKLPPPDYYLGVGSGSHGYQTAEILKKVEDVLFEEKPDWVLVFGDTNSTLAGALASAKLKIPLAHVEAGLRSFNKKMPEEINRILTDHISDILFCPTKIAVDNLKKEGFHNIISSSEKFSDLFPIVVNVGDIMYESLMLCLEIAEKESCILEQLGLKRDYFLVTVHRAENTDNLNRLLCLISAFKKISQYNTVVFPVHPRTKKLIAKLGVLEDRDENIKLIDPVSFMDMLVLEKNAKKILTDSGGVQKEAYILQIPCITLRDETEWLETVEHGWNKLVGTDLKRIVDAVLEDFHIKEWNPKIFGSGKTSEEILEILINTKCGL